MKITEDKVVDMYIQVAHMLFKKVEIEDTQRGHTKRISHIAVTLLLIAETRLAMESRLPEQRPELDQISKDGVLGKVGHRSCALYQEEENRAKIEKILPNHVQSN